MAHAHTSYLPAAGHHWALPLYDPLVKLLGGHPTRAELVRQAALRPRQRVLEIGCGTGSLLVEIKRSHPDVETVGLDPDPKALGRARRKANRAALPVQLDRGLADALPYPDASFDRVFSSFMFHHLPADSREPSLREVRRVLKPGGSLHLLDFAGADTSGHGSFTRLLHASHRLEDNAEDRLLSLMQRAGFAEARRVAEGGMLFGHIRVNYYKAT